MRCPEYGLKCPTYWGPNTGSLELLTRNALKPGWMKAIPWPKYRSKGRRLGSARASVTSSQVIWRWEPRAAAKESTVGWIAAASEPAALYSVGPASAGAAQHRPSATPTTAALLIAQEE